ASMRSNVVALPQRTRIIDQIPATNRCNGHATAACRRFACRDGAATAKGLRWRRSARLARCRAMQRAAQILAIRSRDWDFGYDELASTRIELRGLRHGS